MKGGGATNIIRRRSSAGPPRARRPEHSVLDVRMAGEGDHDAGTSKERRLSKARAQDRDSRGRYKRPFDLLVLILAHVAFLPVWIALWIIIPLAIWLGDRGPVFYTQVRVGRHGNLFRLVKFRTMIRGAEDYTGPIWAADSDRRITPIGRILRPFRLDEVPQVVNIWRGEMSLVGPRPERPELMEEFSRTLPQFSMRLRVRPGVAGLAQVQGSYSTSPRNKLRYDNLYIENIGSFLDLKLLVRSLWAALRGSYR